MPQPITAAERESRRRALLESAMRTFAEHGFARAKTRGIAAGAGVREIQLEWLLGTRDGPLRARAADVAEMLLGGIAADG